MVDDCTPPAELEPLQICRPTHSPQRKANQLSQPLLDPILHANGSMPDTEGLPWSISADQPGHPSPSCFPTATPLGDSRGARGRLLSVAGGQGNDPSGWSLSAPQARLAYEPVADPVLEDNCRSLRQRYHVGQIAWEEWASSAAATGTCKKGGRRE